MKFRFALLPATALSMVALPATAENFSQTYAIGLDIPDSSSTGRQDIQTVSVVDPIIASVNVTLSIAPSPGKPAFLGDLFAYVEHGGKIAVLLNRPGRRLAEAAGSDDNQSMNVTFTDGSPDIHAYRPNEVTPLSGPLTGTFSPDGRASDPGSVLFTDNRSLLLSGFLGANANGDWKVFVADLSGGGEHRLESWGLEMSTSAIPEPQVWAGAGGLLAWVGYRLVRQRAPRSAS